MTHSNTRGWQATAGLAVVSALILGLTLCTMGMFLGPVMSAFDSTNAKVSQATTCFLLAMTLATPLLGLLINRIGARSVMTAGAVMVAAGYWMAAGSDTADDFIVAMAIAGAGVGASTYVPSTIVIASWVEEKRGLAMGIYMCVAGIGSSVLPLWVAQRLTVHDWRATLQWIAAAVAIVAIPVLLAVARTRPGQGTSADAPLSTDHSDLTIRQALRTRTFWLVTGAQILTGLSFQGIYPFIVPHLQDVGFSIEMAAMLFGLVNLTSIGGALLFGGIADWAGPKRAFLTGLLICGLSSPLLLAAGNSTQGIAVMIGFAILWGATSALPNQLVPLLLANTVGQRHFGSILGVCYLIYGVSMAAGPQVTGHLYDATQSYAEPFLLFSLLMTLAAIPVSLIRAGAKARTQKMVDPVVIRDHGTA